MRRDYETGLRAIITRGIDQGIFTVTDPGIAAMAILSMLTGITTWYKSGGRLRPEDIENQYSQLALSAVGVPHARAS